MYKVIVLGIAAGACVLSLGGCAGERASEPKPVCVVDSGKVALTETAEDVLAGMHFIVDKADYERGIIRTRPLRAAQSFEFWRSDNVGAFNSAEANLHTIRRTADVNITQVGGQICVECVVRVERMSLGQRPAVSTSRAAEMFSKGNTTSQELELDLEQRRSMAWIDLGRDYELETEILKRIAEKVQKHG